jgi:RNA polymerase sigma factor (sigma-70 family)
MKGLFQETIRAAERGVDGGEESVTYYYVERLLGNPSELQSGGDEGRAYLAVLLDTIGLRKESIRVLRDAFNPGKSDDSPALQNMEGMLAAAHGRYKRASDILNDALYSADSPQMRGKILANLAAVSLQAGRVDEADAWVNVSKSIQYSGDPAADVLIASVEVNIASARGNKQALRAAASSLRGASGPWIAELGPQHPQALAVVANMANAEIMVAYAEDSPIRLQHAIDVLEVAAFRLVAELGIDHPQSLRAMANLASANFERALTSGSAQNINQANVALAKIHGRIELSKREADIRTISSVRRLNIFGDPVRVTARLNAAQFNRAVAAELRTDVPRAYAGTEPWHDEVELARRIINSKNKKERNAALTVMVRQYDQVVTRFCAGMLSDPDAALDAAQNTFAHALTRLGEGRGPTLSDDRRRDELSAWLHIIARGNCIRLLRRRAQVFLSDVSVDDLPDDVEWRTGEAARRAYVQRLIDSVVATLTERQTQIYGLRFVEELSIRQIAERLDVSPRTAGNEVGILQALIADGVSALILAREGRDYCPDLGHILDEETFTDERFTSNLRNRIIRHFSTNKLGDACPICSSLRHQLLAPYSP